MSTSPESQTITNFRSRRTHQKSRNGCFECKRRKLKCDELKPSCGRCNTMLQKCSYPSASLYMSASGDQRNESCEPSPPLHIAFPFPNSAPYLEPSLPPEGPIPSPYGLLEVNSKHCYHVANAALQLSDIGLYQHYMEHTSQATKYSQVDQMIVQIVIPKLALTNKTVFHSLLALAAVCLGCDMISRDPPPDLADINQVMMIGYRHYNLASEKLRGLISQLGDQTVEPLIASNMLLVPFSAASQQLHHWVSRRSGGPPSGKLLCSTPRDLIVIMRGFRTILQALGSPESRTVPESPDDAQLDRRVLSGSNIVPPMVSTTMSTHAMFPILAATSQEAFSQLQSRLDLAGRNARDARYLGDPLSACVAAFEVLDLVRIAVFSLSNPPALRAPTKKDRKPLVLKSVWPPQVVPWPGGYVMKPALPSAMSPLTRMLLAFVVQVPQAYFDIVLPLLEQRLETGIAPSPPGAARQLTAEQALALEIYAYWSVLMFLIEKESWWVGSLPVVTLGAMINRFGDEILATQSPEQDLERDRWWPGIMLTVSKEISRR